MDMFGFFPTVCLSMRDFPAYRGVAIRYWEMRRLVFNTLLVVPAAFGYIITAGISAGVGDLRYLETVDVVIRFAVSCVAANLCYSFVYAFEFLLGSDNTMSWWRRYGRASVLVSGTLFAMFLALLGGHRIAVIEYLPLHLR